MVYSPAMLFLELIAISDKALRKKDQNKIKKGGLHPAPAKVYNSFISRLESKNFTPALEGLLFTSPVIIKPEEGTLSRESKARFHIITLTIPRVRLYVRCQKKLIPHTFDCISQFPNQST